jgi:hypothetical protein
MTSAAPRHEPEILLTNLLAEIRGANARLDERDSATRSRLATLEATVNDLMRRAGRPSAGFGETDERTQAVELLRMKHHASLTKHDPLFGEPNFSSEQVSEATLAIKGIKTLMHSTSIDQLPLDQRKALSAFSFGSQGFMLAPEQSNEILSCLVDIPDITALMRNISISGSSIKFFVDNETWDVAAWACESSCFANNPTQHWCRHRRGRIQAGELALHCLCHARASRRQLNECRGVDDRQDQGRVRCADRPRDPGRRRLWEADGHSQSGGRHSDHGRCALNAAGVLHAARLADAALGGPDVAAG